MHLSEGKEKMKPIFPTTDALRASPTSAYYLTLAKIFLTSKFSYLLICNPTYKTETGDCK
jgi:hypothetical protein